MTDLWTYLKSTPKPIVLYGMGNGADKILEKLSTLDITVSGVFVSDGFVRDKLFHGMKLMSYADARRTFGEMLVLTAFGSSLTSVMDNIKRIACECELYAPDLAVVGDGVFDAAFYDRNRAALELVRSRLADAQSVTVFDDLVRYKLTGDITPLCACETPVSEAYENILRLGDDEVFVDLGAYRGDTVAQFMAYTDGYRKIYAVEPDPKTFKKLTLNVPQDVVCLNAAVSDKDGTASFDMQSGRSSRLSDNGVAVRTVTVDGILDGGYATYIKMDVEGNERRAIDGARLTISRFAPKLNIAAYHRTGDLFEIPLQVLEINPDYKVYLRHNPYIPAWDVNYYFV